MGDCPSALPTLTWMTWWNNAVGYEVYIRSFADSNGDGVGDFAGLTDRLEYLAWLGIDAVWVTPFYPSPQFDFGYDVADYRAVDAVYGLMDDFDRFAARARKLGLRVMVDLVPNHTSDEHAWFRQALADGPGSTARARYMFREGNGEYGEEPPVWFHDIFRPDGTPYRQAEVDYIRSVTGTKATTPTQTLKSATQTTATATN